MRSEISLTDKQRKAMMPYQQSVGGLYRILDRLRDSILNEDRKEFDSALEKLRDQLTELKAFVSPTQGSEQTSNSESSRSSPNSVPLTAAREAPMRSALDFSRKDDESWEKLRSWPPASPKVQ
jgi:hypothetical protein